jgi:hypothetical protein
MLPESKNGQTMDWNLVFQLSLFGLAMGIATVFVIPSNIEPWIWLVIFCVCAFLIARVRSSLHFLHGLLVGVVNGVWITSAHIIFFNRYIANHAKEAAMMKSTPLPDSPRLMMALVGPSSGLSPVWCLECSDSSLANSLSLGCKVIA